MRLRSCCPNMERKDTQVPTPYCDKCNWHPTWVHCAKMCAYGFAKLVVMNETTVGLKWSMCRPQDRWNVGVMEARDILKNNCHNRGRECPHNNRAEEERTKHRRQKARMSIQKLFYVSKAGDEKTDDIQLCAISLGCFRMNYLDPPISVEVCSSILNLCPGALPLLRHPTV
ncbi:hypothetical protein Tco_1068362 [Tanacetum coccineum]|uniref:Uncharacterized protein n=1 Tax=Tanacetum coccineum TaxID=301880 RepID=A0ABQ5HFH6_9ASTR